MTQEIAMKRSLEACAGELLDIHKTCSRESDQSSKMLVLYLPLILLLTAHINARALNLTRASFDTARPAHRLTDRLPNPYRIPDSQITLNFLDHFTGPVFPRQEMLVLLDKARADVMAGMNLRGDTPIPLGTHQSQSGKHTFVYESRSENGVTRVMKYSEVLAVIRGFSTKARVDECRYRLATVWFIKSDGSRVETGDAAVLKRALQSDDA